MQYPLTIRFKLMALASQITVTDATGAEVFYVKQKMFKLKENIEIYRDNTKSQLLFTVKADKVLDFSPTFTLADATDRPLGTIKRQGARSLWKASYDLQLSSGLSLHVREADPWIKVVDGLLGEIPIVGLFSGYLFHPKYVAETTDGSAVAVLEKKPAFFEGVYELQGSEMAVQDEVTQTNLTALFMIVVLLERNRG